MIQIRAADYDECELDSALVFVWRLVLVEGEDV
jgi:hypothetical protein